MTNRYIPNETACPVDLNLLGTLLRAPEARVVDVVDEQDPLQRAALAVFCFQRAHMRDLGVLIAKRCSAASLRSVGGSMSEHLIEQAQSQPAKTAGDRRKVSLARVA